LEAGTSSFVIFEVEGDIHQSFLGAQFLDPFRLADSSVLLIFIHKDWVYLSIFDTVSFQLHNMATNRSGKPVNGTNGTNGTKSLSRAEETADVSREPLWNQTFFTRANFFPAPHGSPTTNNNLHPHRRRRHPQESPRYRIAPRWQ
jgi:hypothetical protein